jgi:hypothetical protein
MTTGDVVNSAGLFFDLVGAALLLLFGLPEGLNRSGKSYLLLEDSREGTPLLAYAGLPLLLIGFALQLLSNFV